jgi:quercetin dioxygenase-like cupin family protein
MEARFATTALECEQTGLAYFDIKPGQRQFAHRHAEQEELYVVLAGGGRARMDDEVIDVTALDAIRVAPATRRAFEAGPDGMQLLAFGTPAISDGTNDAEILKGEDAAWPGDPSPATS